MVGLGRIYKYGRGGRGRERESEERATGECGGREGGDSGDIEM